MANGQSEESISRSVSQRPQHDQRSTQNVTAPALRPQASSISSIIEAGSQKEDDGLKLAESLGIVAEGVQDSMPYLEKVAEDQYEKGQQDALLGKESPENDIYWRVQAFEQTKGENIAREDFETEVMDYLESNKEADPQEFQEGLEEITKSYVEGGTENWLQGFAPVAKQIEQKTLDQYQQNIMEQQREEEREQVRSLMRNEFDQAINGFIDNQFEDLSSLDDLLEQGPVAFNNFFNQENNKEMLNDRLHEILKVAQERGEAMDMTKQEISDMFIDYTMRTAMQEGVPEMLDVLYKEDKDGIALVDTTRVGDIESAKQEAESVKQERAEMKQKMLEKEREEERKQLYRSSYDNLLRLETLAIEDPEKAMDEARKLREENIEDWSTKLDKSQFKDLTQLTNEIVSGAVEESQAIDDDPEVVSKFREVLAKGEIPARDDIKQAHDNDLITDDTYIELIEQRAEREKEVEEKASSERGKQYTRMVDNVKNYLVNQVEQGVYEDPKLANSIEENIYSSLWQYRRENNFEYPDTQTFIEEMINPALAVEGKSYNDVVNYVYSSDKDNQASDMEVGLKQINSLVERDESFYEEAGELADQAEDEGSFKKVWRNFVGESANVEFQQMVSRFGIGTEEDLKFFADNNPQDLFSNISTMVNEEDYSVQEIFNWFDDQVDSSETPITESTADSIKAGVVAREIVHPLFNERVVRPAKNEEKVPRMPELQMDLIERLSNYGVTGQKYQSMAISYLAELYNSKVKSN